MSQRLATVLVAATLAGCTNAPSGTSPVPSNRFGVPTEVGIRMPDTTLRAAAAFRTQAGVPSIAQIIRENAAIAHNSSAMIKTILGGVAKARLVPGLPVTFKDGSATSGSYTVLLSVLSDHAVISIGDGASATGSAQVFGLAYTSPSQGHAVFRFRNHPNLETLYLAEDYDATAGVATLEGYHATPTAVTHGHWEFQRMTSTDAASPDFRMQVTANIRRLDKPEETGIGALTAAFLPDQSAAALFGLKTVGTGNQLLLMPVDGISWADPAAARDFYMDAKGRDLPRSGASSALKAILPGAATIGSTFPTDPATVQPEVDPRFAFPALAAATASL